MPNDGINMDRDELLSMMDLDGSDVAAESVTFEEAEVGGATAAFESSPYAFETDPWAARRGADLLASAPTLAERGVTEEAMSDFHTAAFDPAPRLLPSCRDATRHDYLTAMVETPEWRALNHDTALNSAAAELAALHFAKGYVALKEDRGGQDGASGGGDKPGNPGNGKDALARAGEALRAAAGEVDEFRAACDGCGLGEGPGGKVDPTRAVEVYRKVRSNASLLRIMEHIGRFRRVAQSRQRTKLDHGVDDMVGVTTGGDVARLVPLEVARLMLEETKLDAFRRLADRTMLEREHRGVEPQGRGPIVVLNDQSGSMAGTPDETAKGLCGAMAYVARRQRRWCVLVSFSGGESHKVCALPPDRFDEVGFLDWLSSFLGGGTEADVPFGLVPGRLWESFVAAGMPRGKTDMVIVTDGEIDGVGSREQSFIEWKARENVRLTSVLINHDGRSLQGVSDEMFRVRSLDPSSEPIGRLLSV